MEGSIWKWQLDSNPPHYLASMEQTVTCVRWCHGTEPKYLSLSDIGGHLAIYRETDIDGVALEKLVEIEAHVQQPHVHSHEIWSVAWSPCGSFIATAGEDHCTHIYRFTPPSEGKKASLYRVTILKGPTMAVTCLDWRSTAVGDLLVGSSGMLFNLTLTLTLLHPSIHSAIV